MARFGLRGLAGGIEISLDGTTVHRHLPPVLYREGSGWADLFRTAAAAAGTLQPAPAPP